MRSKGNQSQAQRVNQGTEQDTTSHYSKANWRSRYLAQASHMTELPACDSRTKPDCGGQLTCGFRSGAMLSWKSQGLDQNEVNDDKLLANLWQWVLMWSLDDINQKTEWFVQRWPLGALLSEASLLEWHSVCALKGPAEMPTISLGAGQPFD